MNFFLSRDEYNRIVEILAKSASLAAAYGRAKKRWSLAGVSVTTTSGPLVEAIKKAKM